MQQPTTPQRRWTMMTMCRTMKMTMMDDRTTTMKIMIPTTTTNNTTTLLLLLLPMVIGIQRRLVGPPTERSTSNSGSASRWWWWGSYSAIDGQWCSNLSMNSMMSRRKDSGRWTRIENTCGNAWCATWICVTFVRMNFMVCKWVRLRNC